MLHPINANDWDFGLLIHLFNIVFYNKKTMRMVWGFNYCGQTLDSTLTTRAADAPPSPIQAPPPSPPIIPPTSLMAGVIETEPAHDVGQSI